MNIVVVYNPKSGSSPKRDEIKTLCAEAGVEVEEFIPIDESPATKLKKHIAKKAYIAVVGGDGTVNAVANQVAGTDAILVPLPGGTFNNFTNDLGLPADLSDAIKRLPKAKIKRIDAASVNGKYFLNNSSIGLHPLSLQTREELRRRYPKWLAIAAGALSALFKMHLYHLEIDGKSLRTPFLLVGNNTYQIDSGVPKRTRLDKGVLSLFVSRTHSHLGVMKIIFAVLLGRRSSLDKLQYSSRTSIEVSARRSKLHISYDGEVAYYATPLRYEIHPKIINVLA